MERADRDTVPRLVLHFDVNETILVGDPAGGDTFEESLHKIVCKSSYVREGEPTLWYTGSHVDEPGPPPLHTAWEWPDGCVAAYRHPAYRTNKKTWVNADNPGAGYRGVYDAMEAALRLPADAVGTIDPRLCHDGVHHFLLPAFFRTITTLAERGREFTVVIRTYGTDVDDVVAALNAYAEGKHATCNAVPGVAIDPADTWHGSYAPDGSFVLTRAGANAADLVREDDVVRALEARARGPIASVACTDDYKWWSDHGCAPSAGKPLWITSSELGAVVHIFFDDNIHNIADDSIVAARQRETAGDAFTPLSGEATIALQGVHLVRTPTVEPILNDLWFVEQIDRCEAALAARRA